MRADGGRLTLGTLAIAMALGLIACGDSTTTQTRILFLAPEDRAALTVEDDVDAERPGIQFDLQVGVLGFGDDGSLSLEVVGDPTTLDQVQVDGDATYFFTNYSLPDGEIELTTTLLDIDGGEVASATISLTVESDPDDFPEPRLVFLSPTDGAALTQADDADDDAFNGFQLDVALELDDIPDGTEVTLSVDGDVVETATVDGTGLDFDGVEVPISGADEDVLLTVSALVDEEVIRAEARIFTDVACVVEIDPTPVGGGSCDITSSDQDANPERDGFQSSLTVRTNCPRAEVTVNGASDSEFVDGDEASFEVTFDQGDNALVAEVSDVEPIRRASSDELTYVVDTELPEISITAPIDDDVLFEDRDADPTNGFQFAVSGTAAGEPSGMEVTLRVDGVDAGTATLNEDGAFFGEVTVMGGGFYELDAVGVDDCGNRGRSETVTVEVLADTPGVAIIFPEGGSALLADGDPDGGTYAIDVQVQANEVEADADVFVDCRTPLSFLSERGSATRGTDDPVIVPIVLPNGTWICRARTEIDDLVFVSGDITFFVDNEAPEIIITAPEDGSFTAVEDVVLEAFVTNFDPPDTVTYSVNDGEPVQVDLTDGGLSELIAVADGVNTVLVAAQEALGPLGEVVGNRTEASVTVTLDTIAPVVTFVHPPPGVPTIADDDPRLSDQFFYDVLVAVDEVAADGEVCLTANGGAAVCVVAVDVGDGYEAAFDDTFILPGENTLLARALDDAGNEGTDELTVDYTADLPRLEWVQILTSDATISPVDGAVIDTDQSVAIHLQTTDLPPDSFIQFVRNGVMRASQAPDGTGLVIFNDALLEESQPALSAQGGFNELDAYVVGTPLNRAPTARVRVDITAPEVAFTDLSDDEVISLAAGFTDAAPRAGFQLAVALTVTGVEDGLDATVSVDCADDAFDGDFTGAVSGSSAIVEVDLPPDSDCTLLASVSDQAGNPANPVTIDVVVDVEAPTCDFTEPDGSTGEAFVDSLDDEEPGGDIQLNVEIEVTGGQGNLTLTDGAGIDLSEPISGPGTVVVTFDSVTFPDGEYVLTTEAFDDVGNSCNTTLRLTASSNATALFFSNLADNLNTTNDMDTGTGGWQGDIIVGATGSFPGQPATLCRSIAPGGSSCSDPEFEVVDTATMQGSTVSFQNLSMSDVPSTRLLAELDLGPTIVRSDQTPVCIDTVRPTLVGWTLDNDAGGDGWLNASEAPSGQAVATVTLGGLSGPRPVQIFSSLLGDETPVATGTSAGVFTFTTTPLPQGMQQLRAEVTDLCGNSLASTSSTLSVGVDTVLPTLSWVVPTDLATILAAQDDGDPDNGAQITIDLLTNVGQGETVNVTGLTLEEPLVVAADSHARAAATLAQGQLELTASVIDAAGNQTVATADVTVDVRPPTIALTLPEPIVDADPSPGYQLDVVVDTTYAETGRAITVRSSAADDGVVSEPASVGATTGGDLAASTVVRLDLPVGLNVLTAQVSDINGNVAFSDTAEVDVAVVGCGLRFVSPTGSPLLVDATGAGGGSKLVDAVLSVVDVAGCADPGDPAMVRVRLGCSTGAADVDCLRVYTAPVAPDGLASFTGASGIEFFDGEAFSMHGIVEHPGTTELSATNPRSVIVDLSPPVVAITRPGTGNEAVLSLADDGVGGWTVAGANITGTLAFTVDDAYGDSCQGLAVPRTRCAFSARYQGGALLNDGGGALDGRAISTPGSITVNTPGVTFPTVAGTTGTNLEVTVWDEVGNAVVTTVPLNVDVVPPSANGILTVDQAPYAGFGVERNGRADLTWAVSNDDGGAGGAVLQYDIRAMCGNRTTRPLLPGAASTNCSVQDWSELSTWTARPLVETITDGSTATTIDQLGVDEVWTVGVRAFDEVGNPSAVRQFDISTRLTRVALSAPATFSDSPSTLVDLGDVNDDGADDLLIGETSNPGQVLLIMGEPEAGAPVAGSPFTISPPAAEAIYFGSGLYSGNFDGDAYMDFAVASGNDFSGNGNTSVYIFFGGPATGGDLAALLAPDITITVTGIPAFALVGFETSRSGRGNFMDLGGAPVTPYDDFYFTVWDPFTFPAEPTDMYVVLGRSGADWAATGGSITVASRDGTANCANDVVTILGGTAPDGEPTSRSGRSGGFVQLDDDANGYLDLVASTAYLGEFGDPDPTPSAQYIFYGGQFLNCPDDLELADANEVVLNNLGPGTFGDTYIAVNPGGREYAVGVFREDQVEFYRYDDGAGAVIETTSAVGSPLEGGQLQFGQSLSFAGDFDGDASGEVDLFIGAPANNAAAGILYFVGYDDVNRYRDPANFRFEAGGSVGMGIQTVAGFDYNGDLLPDAAVADQDNETVTIYY